MPQRPDGTIIDWAAPIREAWDFSEEAALEGLERFIAAGRWDWRQDNSWRWAGPAGCALAAARLAGPHTAAFVEA